MTVFLISSPVLVAIIAGTCLAPRFGGPGISPIRHLLQPTIWNPVIVSVLAFVPMILLYLVLSRDGLFSYTPGGLFFKALIRDYLGWFAVQSLISFAVVRRGSTRAPADQFVLHLIVGAALLTLLALAELVIADSIWTAEEILLKPFARAILLVLFPVAITVADNARGGGWAALLLLLLPPVPAAMTMYAELIRPGGAVLVAALLAIVATGAVWYLLFRGNSGK
jgi:hypothetical protein